MENNTNYQIYCLYHNKVFPRYYGNQIDKITFVKMGNSPYIFPSKKHITLFKEPYFEPIGKEWAEYEFYYSFYKGYKKGLIDLPEYLGFIQYDMEFKSKKINYPGMSVIDFIEKLIKENKLNPKTIVSFQPTNFENIYNEHIIMDPKRPCVRRDCNFENCLQTIIKECNTITKKNLKISDLKGRNIPICGAFFIHKSVFINIMESLSIIIEDGRLNIYNKKDRMQGGLSERYLAVLLEGVKLNKIEFPLKHHFKSYTLKKNLLMLIDHNLGKIGILLKNNYPGLYYKIKGFLLKKRF